MKTLPPNPPRDSTPPEPVAYELRLGASEMSKPIERPDFIWGKADRYFTVNDPSGIDSRARVSRDTVMQVLGPHMSSLHRERSALLKKSTEEDLSEVELSRMAYISWQIETFESAQLEPSLRRLEESQSEFSTMAREVTDAVAALRVRYPSAFPKK